MDIDSTYKFATETFSEYFYIFGRTLAAKPAIFRRAQDGVSDDHESAKRIAPQIFGFIVLSVFFGLALSAVRTGFKFDAVAFVFPLAAWLCYGLVTHGICRLLRGKASLVESMTAMLLLLATIFVLANFIAMGVFALTRAYGRFLAPAGRAGALGNDNSGVVYYVLHVALLMVYVPLILGRVHKFRWGRMLVLSMLPLTLAVFGVALLIALVAHPY